MPNHLEHLRRHAERHHETHQSLKEMLQRLPPKEKVWHWFLGAFVVTLVAVGIYGNWEEIAGIFKEPPAPKIEGLHGFQAGALSSVQLNRQVTIAYEKQLQKITAQGGPQGVKATHAFATAKPKPVPATLYEKSVKATRSFAYYKKTPAPYVSENMAKTSAWMTNYLGRGEALTPVKNTQNLQKSVVATYYLGEKSPGVESVLKQDARLLENLKNTLSLDLFQYLNQAPNRAEALDGYLRLLKELDKKTQERMTDLQGTIAFLKGNLTGLAPQIDASEKGFFENLDRLDSATAEEDLAKFIGLRQDESEVRAKLGAYQKLQAYYQFFQPRIKTMIKEVELNREALIAGVKVTEIQNMTLPLIIRGQ